MFTQTFCLLLSLTAAIHPVIRSRDAGKSTIADVLLSSSGSFDQTNDFDIFTQLLRDAKLISILSEHPLPNGITLLAPNDMAMLTSARDVATARGFPMPTDEREAYETYKRFSSDYVESDAVLSGILMFHIVLVDHTFQNIMDELGFETMLGETLVRHGVTMQPLRKQVPPMLAFPPANLIVWRGGSVKTINGHIHSVDRVIFPSMAEFNLIKSKPELTRTPPELDQTSLEKEENLTASPMPTSDSFGDAIDSSMEPEISMPVQSSEAFNTPTSAEQPGPVMKPTGTLTPTPSEYLFESDDPLFSEEPDASFYLMQSPEPALSTEPIMSAMFKPSEMPSPMKSAPFSVIPVPSVVIPGIPSAGASFQAFPSATIETEPSPVVEDIGPECFPASATVLLNSGETITMKELKVGHVVAVNEHESSRVYLFTHKIQDGTFEFVQIETANGHVLKVTEGHYIYVNGHLEIAGDVRRGDELRTVNGTSKVVRVRRVMDEGMYAPHSLHGDIVVDGVVASSYTNALNPIFAHAVLWPFRAITQMNVCDEPLGGLLYSGASPSLRFLSRLGNQMHSLGSLVMRFFPVHINIYIQAA